MLHPWGVTEINHHLDIRPPSDFLLGVVECIESIILRESIPNYRPAHTPASHRK